MSCDKGQGVNLDLWLTKSIVPLEDGHLVVEGTDMIALTERLGCGLKPGFELQRIAPKAIAMA